MNQSHRRRCAALVFMTLLSGGVAAASAQAAPIGSQSTGIGAWAGDWTRTVEHEYSAQALGLSRDASARTLARAAIRRSARQLRLGAEPLRLVRDELPGGRVKGARPMRMLRFQQTLGGSRVLWSGIDVAVAGDRVLSIEATTVPLKRARLGGERRLSGRQAVAIARRAVPGADHAWAAQPIAYAGEPDHPRAPRRAYVVGVAPDRDETRSMAVVVDAETGKVLFRWRGGTARPTTPRSHGPLARAAGSTVLWQITNFDMQPAVNGYLYGKTDRTVSTAGNPYLFGTDSALSTQLWDGTSPVLKYLSDNVLKVGKYFCLTRGYCGRDSGTSGVGGGDYNRFFVVGNWNDGGDRDRSQYQPGDDHIMIGGLDTADGDVFAHEFGHLIDHHYQNDYVDTFKSQEVDEALADMFFIDAMRTSVYDDYGANGSHFDKDFASHDPAVLGGPHSMSQYAPCATDEHHNGTILAHAYWTLTQSVGHQVAGQLLQYIPMALPAARTFASVRASFKSIAHGLYPGGTIEAAVDAAFAHVGVFDNTGYPLCQPVPTPPHGPTGPVCINKPDLCDDAIAR
jgi:hypothetical protein